VSGATVETRMPVRLRHRPKPTGRGLARPFTRLLGFVAAIALLVLSAREPRGRVEDDPLATRLDSLTHNPKLTSADQPMSDLDA
jgi:hypothetical protein